MEVSGLVKDAETKAPLAGATVSLYVGPDELAVIPSDNNGEFKHSVEDSYVGQTLSCQVEKQGYKTQKVTHEIKSEGVHLEIDLVSEKEITFSLRIKDETGNPLNGVRVSLDLDTEQVGSGFSDENGLFKMRLNPDLEGNTLKYTAKRLFYKTETDQIQIEKETSAEITMKKIVFPLWAKIAAGIAAVVVVAIVILILIPDGHVTVPPVIGKTVREATAILGRAGLRRGKVEGRGTVIEQNPEARKKVPKNTPVDLVLAIRQEPVPNIFSRGTVKIRGTYNCDLDLGKETQEDADFFWQQKTKIIRSITPRNRAKFYVLGRRDFDSINYNDLAKLRYSSLEINGSNNASNQIPQGTVVAAITSKGRYCKFRIDTYGYNLVISWVTYSRAE